VNQFYFRPELRERGITLSDDQLRRNEKAGKFPKRRRISPGRVAWLREEVDAHIATIVSQPATGG
jgi:predicted DNA-binding transcriptional regulator AlpA